MRILLLLASLNGFLAVALGAFGAHGLKARFATLADQAQRLAWWETASQYQMAHALAIGLCAALVGQVMPSFAAPSLASSSMAAPSTAVAGLATAAGYFFAAGILLFSGSLYVMSLTGLRSLGAVTPFGGLCFLVGWGALVVLAFRAVPG